MDPNVKQSIIDRLKQTNNVLVTVKNNPNVDQLAACIGLTLFLNKLGKHATAVFSGAVPSTIEFLKPEDTLEKDTNSLRDFIIALDKSKADKLRYKVEDKVVKIFITPYRTSLSQTDLEFSQGDFNVDVVIALGVHVREELDQAIMAHGRILHDATIVSINNTKSADLGALNWNDPKASSLAEMVASLAEMMQPNSLDAQMATAFLTGIVAETERFSNPKTTSATMSLSAKLMAAGANQQLVASKLQEPVKAPPTDSKAAPGELDIAHQDAKSSELPPPAGDNTDDGEIHIDENGNLVTGLQDHKEENKGENPKEKPARLSRMALDPPTMGGTLTANTAPNQLDPSVDPLSGKMGSSSVISDKNPDSLPSQDVSDPVLPTDEPLSTLEQAIGSPHATKQPQATTPKLEDLLAKESGDSTLAQPAGVDDARKAVEQAAQANMASSPQPIDALNAQPLGQISQPTQEPGVAPNPADTPLPPVNPSMPPNLVPPNDPLPPSPTDTNQPPTAPPPVPPPMMPPSFTPPPNQNNGGGFDAPL